MTEEYKHDDTGAARRHGRRQFLFGTAAAGVGLAAGLIVDAEPADAANGNSLKLGLGNVASATTILSTNNGSGFRGRSTATGGTGVEGNDASPGGSGIGVFGNSAKGQGVYGLSVSGTGVYATASEGFAVSAISDTGTGVFVTSQSGSGVIAHTVTGDYAVYAHCEGDDGYALYAFGNAEVTGTLSKGGGSFKIDHPLDPAHKYLYHSFVESPDMKNVYDGTVTLDRDGRATVELPEWFETLNRDFRYQLTPIGAPAVVYVSAEVADNAFGISGGNPGQRISWQVTGIRQDAWANANRIPVEADKPVHDQGRYLHPDLYEDGQAEPIEALMVQRRQAHRS